MAVEPATRIRDAHVLVSLELGVLQKHFTFFIKSIQLVVQCV